MARMGWKMDASVLPLTFITVNVGVSGMAANAAGVPTETQLRGFVETVLIGAFAAHLSKSYWPLVGPLAYLAFDYVWSTRRGHAPEIGASEDKDEYPEMT
jgi:hypothetical protein